MKNAFILSCHFCLSPPPPPPLFQKNKKEKKPGWADEGACHTQETNLYFFIFFPCKEKYMRFLKSLLCAELELIPNPRRKSNLAHRLMMIDAHWLNVAAHA